MGALGAVRRDVARAIVRRWGVLSARAGTTHTHARTGGGGAARMIARAPTVLSDDRAYQRLSTVGQFVLQVFYRRGQRQVFEEEPGGDAVDAMLLAARHRGALLALDSRAVLARVLVDELAPAGLAALEREGDRFGRVALELTSVDRARVARLAELAALDEVGRLERRRELGRARSERHRAKPKPAAPPGGSGDARPPGVGDVQPPVQPPRRDAVTAVAPAASEGREDEEDLSKSSSSSSPEEAEEGDLAETARGPLPPPPGDARVGDARHSVTDPPGGEGGTPATAFTWNDVAPILGGANGRIGMRGAPQHARDRFLVALDELTDRGATRELLAEMASLAARGKLRRQDELPVVDLALLASNRVLLASWLNVADAALRDRRAAAEKASAARHAQGSLGLPTNAREATSNQVGPPPAPVAPASTMDPRLATKLTNVTARLAAPVRAEPPPAPPSAASGADPPPK